MKPCEGEAVCRRWFGEVWNEGREETIDEIMAEDAVAVGLDAPGGRIVGPAQYKLFFHSMRSAFSESSLELHDIATNGEWTFCRFTFRGRHTGKFWGVPPTFKFIEVACTSGAQVRGGKIVGAWNLWDRLGMLIQLGALPPPPQDG